MHPSYFAEHYPDSTAIVIAETGQSISYLDLEKASNRAAQVFRKNGILKGSTVAVQMSNSIEFLAICWGAQRAGLYFTPISTHATVEESIFIINDSHAELLILSSDLGSTVANLAKQDRARISGVKKVYCVGGPLAGVESWADEAFALPPTPIADEAAGQLMQYSSGTTGRPKGIKQPLPGGSAVSESPLAKAYMGLYELNRDTVFLCPAPLYHTAPLMFSMAVHRGGGVVVLMEKFDAGFFLDAVEKYAVSHTQVVPTMFVRLLKLDESVRKQRRLLSLRYVIHAAAPCPEEVKRKMIDWWGPVIYEYYGGSEAIGSTAIDTAQWLLKPGSVGKANWGTLHICNEAGEELPPRSVGLIYFEGPAQFHYHNDPKKTADSRHPIKANWATLGDLGYVDEDGYLYLTDRKAFMIISGGVNIYPQEAENILIMHPKVADVAVFGVPNPEFGEEVKAVVQPLDWSDVSAAFAQQLIEYCRSHLSPIKCPKSIDFDKALPREANGKLYKKKLQERYSRSGAGNN